MLVFQWELSNYYYIPVHHVKARAAVLHCAAQSGHVEMLMVLLQAGVPVDVRGEDCCTALHFAARNGYENAFRLLLMAGADIHAVNDYGYTCLHASEGISKFFN